MAEVWRVEHAGNGMGPYCYEPGRRPTLTRDLLDAHDGCPRHPVSWKEGCQTGGAWRHACPSAEALAHWFKGWGRELAEAGYLVVRYEVENENVSRGDGRRQVTFHFHRAQHTAALEPWWA